MSRYKYTLDLSRNPFLTIYDATEHLYYEGYLNCSEIIKEGEDIILTRNKYPNYIYFPNLIDNYGDEGMEVLIDLMVSKYKASIK